MRLIIARHGNTFGPGDNVVTAGLSNDLELVEKGLKQAEWVAEALQKNNITPTKVFCGDLIRTSKSAEIVIEKLGLDMTPTVDARLNELDYGDWTGLSDAEITEKFGEEAHMAWQKQCIWPQNAGWASCAEDVQREVTAFALEMAEIYENDTILAFSSNGRMRYFLNMVENGLANAIESQTFKVGTGSVCSLTHNQTEWHIDFWNVKPENWDDTTVKVA